MASFLGSGQAKRKSVTHDSCPSSIRAIHIGGDARTAGAHASQELGEVDGVHVPIDTVFRIGVNRCGSDM